MDWPEHTYLVCYDYGQGGVWAFVRAESEQAIKDAAPQLVIVRDRPSWMTDKELSRIAARMTFDLAEPTGFLLRHLQENA